MENKCAFSTLDGKTFEFTVNGLVARKLKFNYDVDVLDLVDVQSETYKKFARDIIFSTDLMYETLKVGNPFFEEQSGYSTVDIFAAQVNGEVYEEAQRALLYAVVNFIPNKKRREALNMLLDKLWTEMRERVNAMSETLITALTKQPK